MIAQPEINYKKLSISEHAVKRVMERFNVGNKEKAKEFVKSRLGNCKYIGEVTGEDGSKAFMFAHDTIAFYISIDLETVKTVYEMSSHGHYSDLKNKIEELYYKEFRKLDRLERYKVKHLKEIELQCNYEIASLKLRSYKSRSENVKNLCKEKIEELQEQIARYKNEINTLQVKKRQIARAIVTMV